MLTTKNVMNSLSHDSDILYTPSDEELKKIQQILLEIYKDAEAVCVENGLSIMLSGGSAIGAVRHKGFIPWDDDLDVLMTRADFERFAQLFREKYPDKYELTIPTETKESGALYIYPKIHMLGTTMLTLFDNPEVGNHGIHIDIFLIDNAPANGFKRRLKGYVADGKRFLLASGMMYAQRNETAEKYFSASGAGKRNYKIRMAVGRFACALGLDNVLRRYDRFVRQDKESPVSTVPTGRGHYAGEILPTSVFTPAKSVPYEDTTAFIPCDTDAYLKNLFGDYMTLPPEDKRERHSYVKLIID